MRTALVQPGSCLLDLGSMLRWAASGSVFASD